MNKIYALIALITISIPVNAQLVPCRSKICMIDYNFHDDAGPNADKSAIQAAKPDILIDNTHGGLWIGACLPSQYTPLGIKVFSYITGGYEGTTYGTTEDALASNLARVDAIALDGATGVFLDEVTNYPDPADKAYISAIYNECVLKGLKLILNPGTDTFDPWLMDHCDYLMSEESYDGVRAPTTSEAPYADRILVVAQGIMNAASAAAVTDGARTNGFGYSYACTEYLSIPAWLSSYLSAVTHAYAGTITGLGSMCATASTSLVDTATGGAWSSSNPTIASVSGTGIVTGIIAGTANISYTVTNSCGTATALKTVTVNPLPVSGTISGASNVCISASTILTNTVSGGTWSSSSPSIASISSAGMVSGISSGTATISYTVTNSCGTATAIKIITVNPLPTAGFITGPSTSCMLSSITLTDLTIGGIWTSGNPSIADITSTGTVSGIAPGTAVISYAITNSCGIATATKTITVNALPAAITGLTEACTGLTTLLSSATPGGTWASGAIGIATISTSGLVIAVAPGTAIVSYSVATGCMRTTMVTVSPLPAAITGTLGMCVSSTATLHDDTLGGTWNSSDPSIATVATTGLVTGLAHGTATITYTTSSGCTATAIVTVDALPVLSAISGPSSVCVGYSVSLVNSTPDGAWDDVNATASISTSGVVSGIAPGLDTISYSVTNYCGTVTVTKTISINPSPAVPTVSGPSIVCVEHTVTLSGLPLGGIWSGASGNASIIAGTLTGVSVGADVITYTITNTCGAASVVHPITVVPKSDCDATTSVTEKTDKFSASMRVYPNPSDGQFTIEIPETGEAMLCINDLSGKQIETSIINVDAGHIAFYTAKVARKGIYILSVSIGDHTYRTLLML